MNYGRSIYRFVKTLAEGTQMADMVQMIMGYKHCRKGIIIKVIFHQHLLQATKAHSGINYDGTGLCPEIVAVTTASAG
jgi:hypothetical protein